jgi:hypothetical protein
VKKHAHILAVAHFALGRNVNAGELKVRSTEGLPDGALAIIECTELRIEWPLNIMTKIASNCVEEVQKHSQIGDSI